MTLVVPVYAEKKVNVVHQVHRVQKVQLVCLCHLANLENLDPKVNPGHVANRTTLDHPGVEG